MTAEFPLLGQLGLYAADIRGDGTATDLYLRRPCVLFVASVLIMSHPSR